SIEGERFHHAGQVGDGADHFVLVPNPLDFAKGRAIGACRLQYHRAAVAIGNAPIEHRGASLLKRLTNGVSAGHGDPAAGWFEVNAPSGTEGSCLASLEGSPNSDSAQ